MRVDAAKSIFRIESRLKNCGKFGTGFSVHEDAAGTHVVTCRHVITDVGGADQGHINGRKLVDVIADWDNPPADIAIARTEGSLNSTPLPMCDHSQCGAAVTIIGYEKQGKTFTRRSFEGRLSDEKADDSGSPIDLVEGWDVVMESDLGLTGGFSGSPVLDKISGCFTGVIAKHIPAYKWAEAISTVFIRKFLERHQLSWLLHPSAPIRDGASEAAFEEPASLRLIILEELAVAESLKEMNTDLKGLCKRLKRDKRDVAQALALLKNDDLVNEIQRLNDTHLYRLKTKGRDFLKKYSSA